MKEIVVLLAFLNFGSGIMAQSQEVAPGDSLPWEFRKQAFIYSSARTFNDPVVARMALYNLISENPKNVALYDSLAYLYAQYNQASSAVLVSEYVLKLRPDDLYATEIAADSYDKLGIKDRAISYYESLYLTNNDINVLYKISFLQMEFGLYEAAATSSDIIIQNESSMQNFIFFPSDDRQGQKISLHVASLRVQAMIEEFKGNDEAAKQKYLEILQLQPGFQIVQKQLYELNKASKKVEE